MQILEALLPLQLLQPLPPPPQLCPKLSATHVTSLTPAQTPTITIQETLEPFLSELLLLVPQPEPQPPPLQLLQLSLSLIATHVQLVLLVRTHTIHSLAHPPPLLVPLLLPLLLPQLKLPLLFLKLNATHATFQTWAQTPITTLREMPRLSPLVPLSQPQHQLLLLQELQLPPLLFPKLTLTSMPTMLLTSIPTPK